MSSDTLHVIVAGVPRSYQNPEPDGRWLTARHKEQICSLSPRIELSHITENELSGGNVPLHRAEVLLIEASGEEPYGDEISAANMAKLVTPDLKWMQSCSSGIGHILDLNLLDDHVQLTNAAGVHAKALAESIVAAILFHAKKLAQRLNNQRARNWQELTCSELTGQTALIIGTGRIGSATALRARAFGMRTVGIRRSAIATEHFDTIYGPDHLHAALARADYIVIACPLTPETEGMLSATEFALMKPGGYIINIARGKIIDDNDLLHALDTHQIGGAFLDAFSQEPLPTNHPFWSMPNLTVIPHDSHSSPKIGDNIIDVFADNLQRYLAGEELINLIDPERGY